MSRGAKREHPNGARVVLTEAAVHTYGISEGVVKAAEKVGSNWWYAVADTEGKRAFTVRGEHLKKKEGPDGEGGPVR